MKHPKRPTDVNQRANLIMQIATGQTEEIREEVTKNPAAVALGKLGGEKGGKARAKSLTPEKRKEIASKAAKARWKKK